MSELPFAIQKVIDTANDLLERGSTAASTGEQIAAALVLNRKDLLPDGYTISGAWLALTPQWKQHVLRIQHHHMGKIGARSNVVPFRGREVSHRAIR